MKRGEEGGQGEQSAGEGRRGDEDSWRRDQDSWWREPDGEEYCVVRAAVCKRKTCSVVVVEVVVMWYVCTEAKLLCLVHVV
jgi:hypothetical protein